MGRYFVALSQLHPVGPPQSVVMSSDVEIVAAVAKLLASKIEDASERNRVLAELGEEAGEERQ